jgi:hypothetical protein
MSDNPLTQGNAASIIERAKAIITNPKSEWHEIAEEAKSQQEVLIKYAIPLAAIGPLASLIGGLAFGYGGFGFSVRLSIGTALGMAVSSFVMSILSLYVVAFVANALSPKFGGKSDFASAFRLVAYAMTAAWVAGIFGIIPMLSILTLLGLYSFYLFYVGARPMMGVAEDQAATFTVVTIIAAIIVNLVATSIALSFSGMPTALI